MMIIFMMIIFGLGVVGVLADFVTQNHRSGVVYGLVGIGGGELLVTLTGAWARESGAVRFQLASIPDEVQSHESDDSDEEDPERSAAQPKHIPRSHDRNNARKQEKREMERMKESEWKKEEAETPRQHQRQPRR